VRSRVSYALVLLFLLQIWTPVYSIELDAHSSARQFNANDAWNETTFRDIAVLEPFSHQSFADYSDVAIIINNQSVESKIIGTAFALSRNIPPERILLLTNESTPSSEIINSNQFTTFFADPISQMINTRNLTNLNVLVTTKGVPLGVNGGTNSRASFDSELALINGPYASSIFADLHVNSNYGLAAGNEMKAFDRDEQGYYLVSRLTGYDVETALGLIAKTNNSIGQNGFSVLDLATNRNGSGYKWWNDLLYTTNETLTNMGFPVHFNQNSTFVTNMENVSMYAAWGSNDGSWDGNHLANAGYDTSDGSWSTGSRYWDGVAPSLSPGEQWWWARQTDTKRNGNAAMEGRLEDAACGANDAATTHGLLAEYFDNNGITYNISTMVNLSGRTPDFVRHEPNIDWPSTQNAWTGLDSRFLEYWSARHSGIIHVPAAGNWTFYLRSDDGSKLWIDDVEIVDNQGHHSMREISGSVWLDSGEHTLRTEFFEHGGYAGLELKWEGPGVSKQTVPTNVLTRGSSFPVRESSLIHHWEFDESSGDIANDSVGSAHLNFTGTNGNQWRTCVLGNCAFFDGIDDEARVDVADSVTDFTVSLWVQANHSGQSIHASAIAVNDVAGDDDSFQIQTGGGNPGDWELYHNNSYSFGTVDPTVWQHLVTTFENDSVTLYLDGTEIISQNVPNGTVNSIEIYKFGVNRAGNTHFAGVIDEVQIWDSALTSQEVEDIHDEIVWICPGFNTTNNSVTYVEQTVTIMESGDSLDANHAWILDGYSMREGWVEGDWWLEVEAYDVNGTSLSINVSDRRSFSDDWQSRQLRFRPDIQVASFSIRQVAEFSDGTYNGSIFFDTLKLYPIRPHFTWLNGSIAETAVSTGGRTFMFNSSYGQSLVADLLEDGVSGVKGYVYEPYLSGVSNPEQLLSCYGNGYTMSECYAASNVMLSWMGTVVGDPKMAAYSNRLHDVNISNIRAPEILSKGFNGSVEVLLENLAPAEAIGQIEVRDRQNNILLANISLTIPGGNEIGSRLILPVNITPIRTGFVELLVRWIPSDTSSPERVTTNNLGILNIQINAVPEITASSCSTTQVTRGGVVTCEVQVEDDFGVIRGSMFWQINATTSSANWTEVNAGGLASDTRWIASITIPANITLGYVDLHWTVFDAQNLSDEIWIENAFSISDAQATWYGPHVQNVDQSPWIGMNNPPSNAIGWIRGQTHILSACVVDLDHNIELDLPIFRVNGDELPPSSISGVSGSQTCYQTLWAPPAGGSLDSVHITLYSKGIEWNNRTLTPIDLPPTAEIIDVEYLNGANDEIEIRIIDEDDPSAIFEFDAMITWPGLEIQQAIDGPVTAPAGLQQGEATIHAMITNGDWTNLSWEWARSVYLLPPVISTPIICKESTIVNHLTRGVGGSYVWVGVSDGRPIDTGEIEFSTDSNQNLIVSFPIVEKLTPPPTCTPGSIETTEYYRLMISEEAVKSNSLGESEMRVILHDIDGYTGYSDFNNIDIRGASPKLNFTLIPSNITSGKETTLVVKVNDADGNEGTECSVLLSNSDGITLISAVYYPAENGEWNNTWIPPGRDAGNYTLQFACLDISGLDAKEEIILQVAQGTTVPTGENNTGKSADLESQFLSTQMIIAIVILIVLFLIVSSLLFTKKDGAEFEDIEEELSEDAWSRNAGEVSDDILLEMAGISNEKSDLMNESISDWSDNELLAAGWTRKQIDSYREEE